MLAHEKIRNVLSGHELLLTADEQSVVIMSCHLTAMQILDMATLEERRAAVASLPANLADGIKGEIKQEHERRRPAAVSDQR